LIGIGTLLDIGNIVFFIANLPQLITACKNRKNLSGLSGTMLILYMVATIFFGLVAFMIGGYLATILCIINEFFYMAQLYWKRKYK
jgi:uncharacterized protein with PQ loop repeat